MPIDTETYKMIRRLYAVKGLSQRQIAKQLKVSRKTVRKYCEGQVLPDVRNSYALEKSMPRQAIEKKIIEIINANKDAPSKQKLNAKIIWETLIKAGFSMGESTVRKYIRELRSEKPEIFVPLAFEPGEAMEVDWGDAYCYLNNIKTKVSPGTRP